MSKRYAVLNKQGFKILKFHDRAWYNCVLDDTLRIRITDDTGAPPSVNPDRWYRTDDELVAMYIMTKMKVDFYKAQKSKDAQLRLEHYADFHKRLVEKHQDHIIEQMSKDDILVEKFMPTLFDVFIF